MTPTFNSKELKKAKISAVKNHLVPLISPIPLGLTIVSIREASLTPHVRNTFEQLALTGSTKLGIPMSKVKEVLSLYSGNVRQLEQAMALKNANVPPKKPVKHNFRACGSREGFDWFSDEGFCVLEPIIKEADGWLTLEQCSVGPVTVSIADGLFRIRNAAQQAGVWVMVFLVCQEGYEKSRLHEFCDEYIEVSPCEPDIGGETAFSIDCVGLRNLNPLGIGITMCSVKLSEGQFRRRYTPYISSNLETRVMWILRGQGKTLEEIGSLLQKNRSSVLRRLQGLPTPKPVNMADRWLERYLDSSVRVKRKAVSKSDKKVSDDDGAGTDAN